MIFVVAVIFFGFIAIPFVKKQAIKKGTVFSLPKYLVKIAILVIAVFIGGLVSELYLKSPKQSQAPQNIHLPVNVQNNSH